MANWVSQKNGESADELLNGSRPGDLSFESYSYKMQLADLMFAEFPSPSSIQSMSMTLPPFNPSNFGEQPSPTFSSSMDNDVTTGSDDNMSQPMDDSLYHYKDDGVCKSVVSNDGNYNIIPRSPSKSLFEKMLKALSLFKDVSGNYGILAQLWVPIMDGDCQILSTRDQPFFLDQTLAGYREVSTNFTFSPETKPGSFLGLPGRVFSSKVPEWTSNVAYYNKEEYLRVEHAVYHNIRGSIAMPVFENEPDENSCCAVLELVMMIDKPDFEQEMENVSLALEAVDLKSTSCPRFHPQLQCLSNNQRAALADITDVLRTICHIHKLPLALTWIPCNYSQGIGYESTHVQVRGCSPHGPNRKSILCIEDSACYVYDQDMKGFLLACEEHYLEEGQGAAGKALQSIYPYFADDVKNCSIYEYPLVHHARKFNLHSVVAIRLRSIFTGEDDYIIELFLPVDVKEDTEQEVLLKSLAETMQRICKNLRTVSDPDKENLVTLLPNNGGSLSSDTNMKVTMSGPDSFLKVKKGLTSKIGKKRNNAEKSISLEVLHQYFSESLKDAAKSLGVCPTTLKRICRVQGISRWPSRKINKVNNSLKKIQTVINSVKGVDGSFKFDPSIGSLVAAGTINPTQELDTVKDGITQACGEGENDHVYAYATTQATSSGMTSSSNGSGSTGQVSSSSTQNFGERQNNARQASSSGEGGSKITVKATYRGDTIRFKFDTAVAGCDRLYGEIAMRFKLQMGTFQLKYLDDEEEWVLLVNDSDLQECLEILNLVGSPTLKFLVGETSCLMESSSIGGSFLIGVSQ